MSKQVVKSKSGFTEAELAAAAWRKARQECNQAKNSSEQKREGRSIDSRERRKRSVSPKRHRSRSRSRDRSRRQRSRSPRRDSRDGRHKINRSNGNPRGSSTPYGNFVPSSQNRTNINSYGPPKSQEEESDVILDEFGRVRGPDYRPPKKKSPSRSRSRSRSRSVNREWRHDKFHRVLQSPRYKSS